MPIGHYCGRRSMVGLLALVLWTGGIARAQAPAEPSKPKGELAAADKQAKEDAARAAKWLQDAFRGQPTSEAASMLIAIAKGSQLGPGEGWFGPGQSRYGWKWLADLHAVPQSGVIPRTKFLGSESLFNRLDRNKDGQLRADDFDWSDRNSFAQLSMMVNRVFRRINAAGNGRLTREEWMRFYDEAAAGKDHATTDNLRDALLGGPAAMASSSSSEGPSPQTLVRGLFRGEIGSMQEGPKLNDPAPDFSLKSRDGKSTLRLSDEFGKKPIVLVFGNYTCGPFRSMYPRVEELAQRYKNDAIFLMVYVREAHPTDGWRMGSNDQAGVTAAQPRDFAERCALAGQCSIKLEMTMPLLVDEIDDRVGNAYSGMPARLYLIDRTGKIAHKSGRGPFGFKPDELEQSLVMMLLEQQRPVAAGPSRVTKGPAK